MTMTPRLQHPYSHYYLISLALLLALAFCYECLPPLVFRYARAERVKFDNYVSALKKVNIISEQTKNNEQALKWAYNIVSTRMWGSDDEKVIVPMADMVRWSNDLPKCRDCSCSTHDF